MCGFTGWYNPKENLLKKKKIIKKMNKTLKYRGPDQTGYYYDKNLLLGHQRLSIIDLKNGKQPMNYKNYTIVYNGEIYNTCELRDDLIEKGYVFLTNSDTEVILKGYVQYKEKILDKLEGIFAFMIYDGSSIFIGRDRFGVKPIFYTKVNDNFLFASEIKALLKNDLVKPIIDKNSLQELLALGPSKTPGSGIFKNIYELRPAHYLKYEQNKITIKRYWQVKEEEFNDTFEECTKNVNKLLTDSIKRQMVSDVKICTFLSGGMDSSIISAVCSRELNNLNTFSIDYKDNQKYFKSNEFQISTDKQFIELMSDTFKTKHHYKVINQKKLAKSLKESVIARDYPGMADIDSSLYWFSKQIKKKFKVALSGECADEIFGGYPWFYNEKIRNRKYFPWIDSIDERNNLLNKELKEKLNLKKYIELKYKETLKEVPKCRDKSEQQYKNLFYINMIWFMPTLLERKDRMTMRASLEARVPFADTKLIEYLWNVPTNYKLYNGIEKGLLRKSFENLLPSEIINRKKNPYPKTHNPKYTKIVKNLLKKELKNKKSILYKIFDKNALTNLIESNGSSFKNPWFGQLMTGPQLLAYLYQFSYWAKKYKIILDI